jgi:hypothetical protein
MEYNEVFLHRESKTIIITMQPAAPEVNRRSLPAKVYRYNKHILPESFDDDGYTHRARIVSVDKSANIFVRPKNSIEQRLIENCHQVGSMWKISGVEPVEPEDGRKAYERLCDLTAKIIFDNLKELETEQQKQQPLYTSYWQLVEVTRAKECCYESKIFYTLEEALEAAATTEKMEGNAHKLIKFPHTPTPRPYPFCKVTPPTVADPVKPSQALTQALKLKSCKNQCSHVTNKNRKL